MENKKSVFQTLFEINVNKQVEKKNGLNYLSWAYAWSEVKKLSIRLRHIKFMKRKAVAYITQTDGLVG